MSPTRASAAVAGALVAIVTFAGVTGAAADKKSGKVVFESTISIKFKGGGSGEYVEQANFSGKVKAKKSRKSKPASGNLKKKCLKDRRVRIIHKSDDAVLRKTQTDEKGGYGVSAGSGFVAGDKYLAEVKRKKVKQGKTKVVCQPATSKAITAG